MRTFLEMLRGDPADAASDMVNPLGIAGTIGKKAGRQLALKFFEKAKKKPGKSKAVAKVAKAQTPASKQGWPQGRTPDFKEYGKFGDELAKLKADPEIVAGEMVDGLRMTNDIPNLSSISASNMEEIGGGVRKMSLSGWHANPEKMFYAADDIERTHALAKRIQESGKIDPLIIAFREDGPYVLEGLHRLGALYLLGKKSFPALVVKETF